MKYTPGPWMIGSVKGGWTCVKPLAHGVPICTLTENNEGNAYLIAAAPNLLEACRFIVLAYEDGEHKKDMTRAVNVAKAAIAMAEGRTL